ncbi:MAG: hypothetical protein ACTMIH_08765 [Microbacterium gubbeenense]|uniref:hypothetical protein n=1 Tax=Microbacterium gubbeenense TaxID=159896 RepID=UPI00041E795A|nr:hypothetical protein [Microbacterium gubbeenense]
MSSPLAWVESPLQLIGAAEWASARGTRIDLAARLTAQVEQTTAELTARGAMFGIQAGYYGVPWRMLASHDHWLIGDGFSGQFRLAAALLRPKTLTFLDDGLNAIAFADALTGSREYARPGIEERGFARRIAPFALDTMRLRAASGRAEVFTAFPLGEERERALRDLGAAIGGHGFEWLRGTAPSALFGADVPHRRVILGSARVVDGHMSQSEYLAWVRRESRGGACAYLPHRREDDDTLGAVARLDGIEIVRTGLPIELVLAAGRAHDIVMLRSSAAVTLRRVLDGTGSIVTERINAAGEEIAA